MTDHLHTAIICTCPLMERCQFSGSSTLIFHHPTQSSGNSEPSVWSAHLPPQKPHIWECPLLLPPSLAPISSGMGLSHSAKKLQISLSQPKHDTVTAPFVTPGGGQEEQGTVIASGTPHWVLYLCSPWLHTD